MKKFIARAWLVMVAAIAIILFGMVVIHGGPFIQFIIGLMAFFFVTIWSIDNC